VLKISKKIFPIIISILLLCEVVSASDSVNRNLDLAISLFEKDAYILAIEQLNKVLITAGELENKKIAYFYLAESYKNLNNVDKAKENYKLVLTSNGYGYSDVALFELGHIAYQQSNYPEAINYFTLLERRYPYSKFHLYAKYWIAESYYLTSGYEQAKHYYNDIVTSSPGFEYGDYARYSLGRIYLLQNNYPQAKRFFSGLVKKGKRELEESSLFFLANAHFSLKEYAAAQSILEKYVNNFPKSKYNYEANLLLAEIAFQDNSYNKAISCYFNLLPESPYLESAYLGMGWSFFQLEKYEEALKEFSRYTAITGDANKKQKVLYQQALIHNKLQQFDKTEGILAQLATTVTDNNLLEKVVNLQSSVLYQRLRWTELIDKTDIYLQNYPQGNYLDAIMLERGVAFYKLKEYEKATGVFEQISSGSYKNESLYFVADIYYKANSYDKAKNYYQLIIENLPNHPYKMQSLYNLAWCSYLMKNYRDSAKYFGQFVTSYKDSDLTKNASFLKSESLLNAHSYSEALKSLEEFAQMYPTSQLLEKAIFYQGYILYKQEKLYEAINQFHRLNSISIDESIQEKARYWEASAYFRLRLWDKARQIFFSLLDLKPKWSSPSEIYLKIADSYYNSKDYANALTYYKKGSEKYSDSNWSKNLQYGAILSLNKLDRLEEAKAEIDDYQKKYNEKDIILQQIENKDKLKPKDN